jgi:hypothetical protein
LTPPELEEDGQSQFFEQIHEHIGNAEITTSILSFALNTKKLRAYLVLR